MAYMGILWVLFIMGADVKGALYSQEHQSEKKNVNNIFTTTRDLGLEDYRMIADAPSPNLHQKMKRFYQHLANQRQGAPHRIINHPAINSILRPPKENKVLGEDYFDSEHQNRIKKQFNETEATTGLPESEDSLQRQYLASLESSNTTFSFTAEEKNSKETFKNKILPANLNCSQYVGYGFGAFQCFDQMQGKQQARLLATFFLFCSTACGFIVFFLWCTKGWCCCCCPCQFCKVDKRLNSIQRYIALNPPGQWTNNNEFYEYDPTAKEIMLYETISRAFMDI